MNGPVVERPVLIVSQGFGYSGDLMYFGEIFRELREIVPDLTIGVDGSQEYENPYNLPLRPMFRSMLMRLPRAGWYDRATHLPSPLLAWRIWRLNPKTLVTIEFTPVALIATAASLLRPSIRRVLLIESDPELRGGSRNRLVLAIKRWAARRAHLIQTNNHAGLRYAVDQLGAKPERVRIAPYLTSRPPEPTAGAMPQTADKLRLLFVNSLTLRKGGDILIDALGLLSPETRQKLAATIVGDGPERVAMETAVADRGLGGIVRFVGQHGYRELGRFYADADLLVCPTRQDYRSLGSFEGLGYGLALLISDRDGAHPETVIEGETGFVFDPEQPARLAELITRFAAEPDLLDHCRRMSAKLYRERFSLEAIAANIADSLALAAISSRA